MTAEITKEQRNAMLFIKEQYCGKEGCSFCSHRLRYELGITNSNIETFTKFVNDITSKNKRSY